MASDINKGKTRIKTLIVGDNGTGKSFILNLMLLNSAVDPAVYSSEEWKKIRAGMGFVKEANHFVDNWSEKESTHVKITTFCCRDDFEFLEILGDPHRLPPVPGSTLSIFRSLQDFLSSTCREFESYLLPSRSFGTITTPSVVTVAWGYTWQLAYKLQSKSRVLSLAYEFISIIKEVCFIEMILKPVISLGLFLFLLTLTTSF